jgi:hypothetical protein
MGKQHSRLHGLPGRRLRLEERGAEVVANRETLRTTGCDAITVYPTRTVNNHAVSVAIRIFATAATSHRIVTTRGGSPVRLELHRRRDDGHRGPHSTDRVAGGAA